MRRISLLIAVCFVLAVMVATISAQGGGGGGQGGRGGGGGAQAPAPTGPAPTGANGAADLPGIMTRIQPTNRGMGTKVTAGDAAGVAADLGTLQSLFMAAQTAFTKEKVKGAADLAKAAADAAGAAQKVATSGKVDATTTKAVTDSCNGCHMTYREKDASGAYKLKAQ
jgi:metal-dependent amidase/aminoacylase/carboxypeptidase family protein